MVPESADSFLMGMGFVRANLDAPTPHKSLITSALSLTITKEIAQTFAKKGIYG
jgi:hypothetical protein